MTGRDLVGAQHIGGGQEDVVLFYSRMQVPMSFPVPDRILHTYQKKLDSFPFEE